LLRFILHDWDDADAIRILESCRRAMKPHARLVVIEAFFAEPGEPIPADMIDTQVPLFDLHLERPGITMLNFSVQIRKAVSILGDWKLFVSA
jgi:hypothetical protein